MKNITTDGKSRDGVRGHGGRPAGRGYVWRQNQGAAAFEKLATLEDVNIMTIDVAPGTKPARHLSGQPYSTIRGQITAPTTAGSPSRRTRAMAEPLERPESGRPALFIGAIDRNDPGSTSRGISMRTGAIFCSRRTAGKTFENVPAIKSAMFGFAWSDDSKTYWAASGLKEDGIFRSDDRGAHFERVSNEGVRPALGMNTLICGNPFTCRADRSSAPTIVG